MADYVTLLGAEQVQSAASQMRSAADSMQSAAGNIQYAFEQHERFLERWLQEFKGAIEDMKAKS